MNHTNTDSTGIRRSLCSGFFEQIYRHPIFSAALVSLIGLVLSTGGVTLSNLLFISVGILALGFAAAFFARRFYGGEKGNLHMALIIASSVITAVLFAFASYTTGESSAAFAPVLMNGGLAVCAAVFFYLLAGNRLSARNIVLLLFAAGFIMRLSYILMMSAVMIQHDVHSLGAGAGHAGYIEYLYANGHLPDFDLREIDQFYHPPIHHILAALWMRLQTMIGIRYADAYENVQVLTLFYSTLSMILSYKIFRRLKLSGSGLIAATAVIAFCPTFYIMSGSVNNDILSVTFMLGAVLNTLNWYQSRSMKHIVYIALCVGFGMITKLSVWMVAPAIGFVFIYVFFTNLKDLKKYLLQYAVFIIICAPIGLFWAVRGFLRWQIPFTYVPRLSETSSQFVGNVPLLQRFFDFSPYQYADVAPQFTMYGGSYNEFNPLIGFFKTSLFDEGIAVRRFPQLVGFSHALFFAAVLLGLAAFGAMIYLFIKRSETIKLVHKCFIGLLYFVIFGMYLIFCVSFPHVCTMNVRYGVLLIVIGALSLGYLTGKLMKSRKKAAKAFGIVLSSLIAVYALCGFMVYHICADALAC